MKMLISTRDSIYQFNLNNNNLHKIISDSGEYYGITWDHTQMYLSVSNIDNASLLNYSDYINSGKGNIKIINEIFHSSTENMLTQPHQILYNKNTLIVCDTGNNRVLFLDETKNISNEIKPTKHEFDISLNSKKNERQHFNSISLSGDSLYVLAHNYSKLCCIYEFDWSSSELNNVFSTQALWAHNIWKSDDFGMVICDSFNQSLYSLNAKSRLWTDPMGTWITRGLAATKDYIIVGLSAFAESREYRHISPGGIAIIDRKTLKTLDMFIFEGIGQVHEVRVISEIDDCHNGIAFPQSVNDHISKTVNNISLAPMKRYHYRAGISKQSACYQPQQVSTSFNKVDIKTKNNETMFIPLYELPFYYEEDIHLKKPISLFCNIVIPKIEAFYEDDFIGRFALILTDDTNTQSPEHEQSSDLVQHMLIKSCEIDIAFVIQPPRFGAWVLTIYWVQQNAGRVIIHSPSVITRYLRNHNNQPISRECIIEPHFSNSSSTPISGQNNVATTLA